MIIYENKKEFLNNMTDVIAQSKCVTIDYSALRKLAPLLPEIKSRNKLFPSYIENEKGADLHEHFKRVFYAIALNVANQSGCVYKDKNGNTTHWQIDGSAAKAVDEKFRQMVEDGDTPTWDAPWVEPIHLDAHLIGVPYADMRKKIFAEFMNEKAFAVISEIVDSASKKRNKYSLTFDHAESLAQGFPVSFGADPFRKKANLVPITFGAYAQYKKVDISLDVIIPTDYRIPQTLHSAGVLKFSDELVEKIEKEIPLAEDSDEVREIRAACIVSAEKLRSLSKRSIIEIDGFLWRAPKTGEMEELKNQLLCDTNSPYTSKHLICYTMHF